MCVWQLSILTGSISLWDAYRGLSRYEYYDLCASNGHEKASARIYNALIKLLEKHTHTTHESTVRVASNIRFCIVNEADINEELSVFVFRHLGVVGDTHHHSLFRHSVSKLSVRLLQSTEPPSTSTAASR
eukprot:402416_1